MKSVAPRHVVPAHAQDGASVRNDEGAVGEVVFAFVEAIDLFARIERNARWSLPLWECAAVVAAPLMRLHSEHVQYVFARIVGQRHKYGALRLESRRLAPLSNVRNGWKADVSARRRGPHARSLCLPSSE